MTCPRCGARQRPPRPGASAGRWLRYDAGGAGFHCDACGLALTGVLAMDRDRGPRWLGPASGPARAVLLLRRVLLQRRWFRPGPYVYALALVPATVAGLGLRRRLGTRWWLPASAAAALLWTTSVASAFTRGRPGDTVQDLRENLTRALSPDGARARADEEEAAIFRSAPLPLYGLSSSFGGSRRLGGSGRIESEITSLSLAHGDPERDGVELTVEVSIPSAHDPGRRMGRRHLAMGLWRRAQPSPPDPSPDGLLAWQWQLQQAAASRPKPEWATRTILVEGTPVDFAWLREGEHWLAYAVLEGMNVTVQARGLGPDEVELVRVSDVEPYIRGQRNVADASLSIGRVESGR